MYFPTSSGAYLLMAGVRNSCVDFLQETRIPEIKKQNKTGADIFFMVIITTVRLQNTFLCCFTGEAFELFLRQLHHFHHKIPHSGQEQFPLPCHKNELQPHFRMEQLKPSPPDPYT